MNTTRRNFLRASLASASFAAFAPAVPGFLARAASVNASDTWGTVLVVIQLSGGNDGLNTVIPFGDDEYHRARPTLRSAAKQVHKLNGELGLHPDMSALYRLYRDGRLSVLQGVGIPNGSRDHNSAMRAWQTAEPGEATAQTGWIGRAGDCVSRMTPATAAGAFVGSIPAPFALHAERAVLPSLAALQDWLPAPVSRHLGELSRIARTAHDGGELLNYVRQTTLDACSAAARFEEVTRSRSIFGSTRYPQQFPLAQNLHTIAQLIRADSGIRIYCAEHGGGGIGGFDTHAGQAANHGALLQELSDSLAAFVDDLRRDNLLDRVLVMTYSEFGRTVEENGRHGTNHGLAAPMFLVGGSSKGGIIGPHPSLKALDAGGLKCNLDFRHVYAALLDRWLGYDSTAILGKKFPAADVLAG